jgi:quercetin dioxygenase-like cupin family protein
MGGNAVRNANIREGRKVTMFPGIVRTTLCYNEASMLCHFTLRAGSTIPLHSHVAAQNGYLVKGKVRFLGEGGKSLVTMAGDGYFFEGGEKHGAEILEDSEAIECFTPMRPEYA